MDGPFCFSASTWGCAVPSQCRVVSSDWPQWKEVGLTPQPPHCSPPIAPLSQQQLGRWHMPVCSVQAECVGPTGLALVRALGFTTHRLRLESLPCEFW